ncbi:MAG: NAD(P)H-hydrate dehydratase [Verrucomicrobiota bacterium]
MSHVGAEEMRAIENAAFARGIDPGELMDRAGDGIAHRLLQHFPLPGTAVAYVGKGNNGGDALVVLEHLRHAGWKVALRAAHPPSEWSPLAAHRLRRLGGVADRIPPNGAGPLLLLDGLLGIGARGPLREPLTTLAAEIESLRRNHGAIVAAMDLPSGLDADTGELHAGGITADLTLTVGIPKSGLLSDQAASACGRLFLVTLKDLPVPDQPGPRLACPELFPDRLPPRAHDFHKGKAGRVSILAGSPGMGGAAVLAATAALRGGAGLVNLYPGTPLLAPPEVMVHRTDDPIRAVFASRADALVLGPGLGEAEEMTIPIWVNQLMSNDRPAVIDADALNWLSASNRLDLLLPQYILTPHPGEFARLAPELADLPRAEAAARFVDRHPCVLLLKGTRSLVAAPGEAIRFNPTGHAGMASGGQGDALAGVCGALLAAGHSSVDAAMLGAWLCGRAAERAMTHGGESPESLTASHTIDQLGGAFSDWRERRR